MSDLDPDLARLFTAERARTTAPADAKSRVLERVLTSVTSPAPTPSPSAAPARSFALGHVAAALVVGVVAGAAVTAAVLPSRVVYVDRAARSSEPSSSSAPVSVPPIERPTEVVDAAAPTPSAARSASAEDSLAKERQILDVARTALGRGDGAHALEAVDRHAKEFPRGQMTEEREAIAVQALAKQGRKDEAASRGDKFKKRYPNSVLLPVIDAALMQ